MTIVDQLYVLADFKVHRYEAELAGQEKRYTTISLGAELGYRWFVYEGLFLNPTVRYWPTVWKSHDSVRLGEQRYCRRRLASSRERTGVLHASRTCLFSFAFGRRKWAVGCLEEGC